MTTTLTIPYLALVRKADPGYLKERRTELEYEFSRRRFFGDPDERGAYGQVFLGTESGGFLLTEDGALIGADPLPESIPYVPPPRTTPALLAEDGTAVLAEGRGFVLIDRQP